MEVVAYLPFQTTGIERRRIMLRIVPAGEDVECILATIDRFSLW